MTAATLTIKIDCTEAIGRYMRAQMAIRGTQQNALADDIEISRGHLADLLNGNKAWRPSILDMCCDALDVPSAVRRDMHVAAARAEGWGV